MSDRNTTRASLRALAKVVRTPVVGEKQLRRNVAEMAAEHTPLAYIRLFLAKVRIK